MSCCAGNTTRNNVQPPAVAAETTPQQQAPAPTPAATTPESSHLNSGHLSSVHHGGEQKWGDVLLAVQESELLQVKAQSRSDSTNIQAVVIGLQSAGKTSLLERFAGGKKLGVVGAKCGNRCPVLLEYRRTSRCRCTVGGTDVDEGKIAEVVEQHMLKLQNTGGFSDTPLVVQVHNPDCSSVTLVDLPGILPGDKPENQVDNLKIAKMAVNYLRMANSVPIFVGSLYSLDSAHSQSAWERVFKWLGEAAREEEEHLLGSLVADVVRRGLFAMTRLDGLKNQFQGPTEQERKKNAAEFLSGCVDALVYGVPDQEKIMTKCKLEKDVFVMSLCPQNLCDKNEEPDLCSEDKEKELHTRFCDDRGLLASDRRVPLHHFGPVPMLQRLTQVMCEKLKANIEDIVSNYARDVAAYTKDVKQITSVVGDGDGADATRAAAELYTDLIKHGIQCAMTGRLMLDAAVFKDHLGTESGANITVGTDIFEQWIRFPVQLELTSQESFDKASESDPNLGRRLSVKSHNEIAAKVTPESDLHDALSRKLSGAAAVHRDIGVFGVHLVTRWLAPFPEDRMHNVAMGAGPDVFGTSREDVIAAMLRMNPSPVLQWFQALLAWCADEFKRMVGPVLDFVGKLDLHGLPNGFHQHYSPRFRVAIEETIAGFVRSCNSALQNLCQKEFSTLDLFDLERQLQNNRFCEAAQLKNMVEFETCKLFPRRVPPAPPAARAASSASGDDDDDDGSVSPIKTVVCRNQQLLSASPPNNNNTSGNNNSWRHFDSIRAVLDFIFTDSELVQKFVDDIARNRDFDLWVRGNAILRESLLKPIKTLHEELIAEKTRMMVELDADDGKLLKAMNLRGRSNDVSALLERGEKLQKLGDVLSGYDLKQDVREPTRKVAEVVKELTKMRETINDLD